MFQCDGSYLNSIPGAGHLHDPHGKNTVSPKQTFCTSFSCLHLVITVAAALITAFTDFAIGLICTVCRPVLSVWLVIILAGYLVCSACEKYMCTARRMLEAAGYLPCCFFLPFISMPASLHPHTETEYIPFMIQNFCCTYFTHILKRMTAMPRELFLSSSS